MTRDTDDTMEQPTDESPAGVLSPDDLKLPDGVAELDEGRYVVPTDEDGQPSMAEPEDEDKDVMVKEPTPASTSVKGGQETAETGPTESLSGAYAAAVTIRTPTGTDATQVETNDVRELFDELLVWYVEQMAPETDPEEALSVLLAESSLSVVSFDD